MIYLLKKKAGFDPKNWTTETVVDNVTLSAASETTDAQVQVENEPGVELPHTGGPGTEAYLTLGALMAVGAGAVLIRRKLKRQ